MMMKWCVQQLWRYDEVGEVVQYRLFQSPSSFWELKNTKKEKVRVGMGPICMYPLCVTYSNWVIGLAVGSVFNTVGACIVSVELFF
jgi:hypothetical protein